MHDERNNLVECAYCGERAEGYLEVRFYKPAEEVFAHKVPICAEDAERFVEHWSKGHGGTGIRELAGGEG